MGPDTSEGAPFVNVYGIVEARPREGSFDVYAVQPTLLAAMNWYLERKGRPLVEVPDDMPGVLQEETPEGPTWVFDRDDFGGHAIIVRYTMRALEME